MIDESIKQGKVKILILPLGHQSSPHCLNEDLQRATWASAMPPGVLVRWLLPSPDATAVEENSLGQVFIPVDPGPAGALEKTIRGLQWALKEYEFDYLIRTNSSSYFSPAQLLREVSGLPLQGLCKGVIGVTDDPRMGRFEFVSGAALMMSRDVVETLAMMDWTKHTDHLEDVEMSVYLAQNGVSFTPGERIELPDGQPLQCSGHVRLKSYALNRVTRRRMIEVHEIFAQPDSASRLASLRAHDRREVFRARLETMGFARPLFPSPSARKLWAGLASLLNPRLYFAGRAERSSSAIARNRSFDHLHGNHGVGS